MEKSDRNLQLHLGSGVETLALCWPWMERLFPPITTTENKEAHILFNEGKDKTTFSYEYPEQIPYKIYFIGGGGEKQNVGNNLSKGSKRRLSAVSGFRACAGGQPAIAR